jgi:hypothetical protein
MPLGASRGRMHVATEVPPAGARMDRDHRSLPPRRPHLAQNRLEPDAPPSPRPPPRLLDGSPAPSLPWSPAFFPGRSFLRTGRFDVAWSRRLRREVEQTQIAQGRRRAHPSPRPRAQPRRHRPAVPPVVVRRRTRQRRPQLLQLFWGGQERERTGTRDRAMVDEAVPPLVVEAARDLSNPVRRLPRHPRHDLRRMLLRQQPENLPVTALHPFAGAPIAPLQLVHAHFCRQLDASCHAHIPHPDSALFGIIGISPNPGAMRLCNSRPNIFPDHRHLDTPQAIASILRGSRENRFSV